LTKNHFFLIAVFIGTFALAFLLTSRGCNKASSEKAETSHSDSHANAETETDLDGRIDIALANIKKGRETEDFELMMQQGVMKLRQIENEDSTNERAIYNLAILSVESGQLEKAKIRFKKLILLQPSNEEYKKKYDEVLRQLVE